MVSTETDGKKCDKPTSTSSASMEVGNNCTTIYVPTAEGRLTDRRQREERFPDFIKARPSKDWLLEFGFIRRLSCFCFLKRGGRRRSSSCTSPPDSADPSNACQRFRVPFVRNVNWEALIKHCKNWMKHPKNMALLVWLFFVAAGLTALFLLMTGLLNGVIQKSSRERWTEITNQIINALFTIMCLYQYPKLFHRFVLLCRWRPSDAAELRRVYCKNIARRPNERAHMALVVLLLHLTCFSQYGLCGLYWGYSSETRPTRPQILFIVLGIVSPVVAGLYVVYGPLGRKLESQGDQVTMATKQDVNELKLSNGGVVVTRPDWVGGLFDCWDDLMVANISFFCTCCVFGWNMERLGFGNMCLHIFTFLVLCFAPVLVFTVAAFKIDDDAFRDMVAIAGVVLCFCGLLYGGFWRIQMRKRFKLPANPFCCGHPTMTDFMQWLFCWSCSLAQEVRTGNFYDVEEGSLCPNEEEDEGPSALQPPPREVSSGPLIKTNNTSSHSHSSLSKPEDKEIDTESNSSGTVANHGSDDSMMMSINKEETLVTEKNQAMQPPHPPLIQVG